MTIFSRFLGSYFKLPPAVTRKVIVEEDLKVPTKDGFILLTDHYFPKDLEKAPVILVRTPYGRKSFFGLLYGRLVCERGYQVLVQSCRGTFGSGGEFFPYKYEKSDGLATIEWMKLQKWYSGSYSTLGGSYMGFTQYAIATEEEEDSDLKAITPAITASEFHTMAYPNGSFSFQSRLDWVISIATQEELSRFQRNKNKPKLKESYNHLPLEEIPEKFFGKTISYWNLFLDEDKNREFWETTGENKKIDQLSIPICMATGWYDIFLPWQLIDYQKLCSTAVQPYLTIGPWAHSQIKGLGNSIRESIIWFNAFLKHDKSSLPKKAVRLFIMGCNKWEEFDQYPPKNAYTQAWYLQKDKKLSLEEPDNSIPDEYTYNPVDPTPNVGGTLLFDKAGSQNNKELESRKDVLTFTSDVFKTPYQIIGPVKAVLYVKSSLNTADFFVRLCDVDKKGTSKNICDGIIHLSSEQRLLDDQGLKVEFDIWPTAFQFSIGHKMRVQVSSGAHPRFIRNLGTNEPLSKTITMVKANQTVFHDSIHPSHIIVTINQ